MRQWTEAGANGEIAAFVEIKLYLKYENEWAEPISATGGSSFVAKETKGLYTSDECFKMAYTDALSVACKMLGIGADVYWDKDKTKYNAKSESGGSKPMASEGQIKSIKEACFSTGLEESKMLKMCNAEKWEDVTATSAAKALQWINTRANAV